MEHWTLSKEEQSTWGLTYNDYDTAKERSREALLTVGNGYFGTRGAMEETNANEVNYPGTYIAGLYNRLKSPVGDRKIENEDFVNATNWLPITFKIGNNEWLDINNAQIISIQRQLNLKNGLLFREIVVKDKLGRKTQVKSTRLASMDNPHIAALSYEITPLNYSDHIFVKSGINGKIINDGVARYRQLNQQHLEPVTQDGYSNVNAVVVRTVQSDIDIATVCQNTVFLNDKISYPEMKMYRKESGKSFNEFSLFVNEKTTLKVEKITAICTTKDTEDEDALQTAKKILFEHKDFEQLVNKSIKRWSKIWKHIDIKIEGDDFSQMLIRLHLYHLMVTASIHNVNIDAGIPARGLHGEAYRGHIFWDEIYLFNLYCFNLPDVAKSILMYRYRRLDEARKYAKEYGYEGAMFPWQSGSDGREETQIVHLNPVSGEWGDDYSSLQRHISIAIAYSVWEYYHVTGDVEFMKKYGAEMFLDICRFWSSKCEFDPQKGKYSIKKVMGPDEFHEQYPTSNEGGINNNAYTNIMVVWLFDRAFDINTIFSDAEKQELFAKINLTDKELEKWKDVTKKMFLEISDEGIISQFEGYFYLKELDWEHYRAKYGNIYRMDRILKAEGKSADDYKVAKQADTLMTFYNLDDEDVNQILSELGYSLPDDYIKKNLEYYIKRTSHGSTLSRVVHAYLASVIKDKDMSWKLYTEALQSDYVDIQGGTTAEGIHCGVMGGTILTAIYTFAGVNIRGKLLKINPDLPEKWSKMSFGLTFKKVHYQIEVSKLYVKITTDKVATLSINNKEYTTEANKTLDITY